MGKEKTLLTIINEPSSSILREEFESFNGKFGMRTIDLYKVTNEIVDLENRPEYCPNIHILQIKKLNEKWMYIFSERIYTNNQFLDNFEEFIRKNMVGIPAKDFDNVPEEYKHFFNTPYALVTCDINRTTLSISHPNGNYKSVAHDKFKGVDFDTPGTLRMLKPEILYNKLDEIEKKSIFSVKIEKSNTENLNDNKFICFEYRYGSEHKTVEHLVFRNHNFDKKTYKFRKWQF